LLDTLSIERVIVLGASGGGPSAISFAAMYPRTTSALIAMEAVSQPIPASANPSAPFYMRYDFLLWSTLSLMDELMGAQGIVELLVPDPEIVELILQDPQKTSDITNLIWSMWPISLREAGQRNDTSQFASLELPSKAVTVPTLILHGTEDINVPFTQSEQLAKQIPTATFHVIEGGDHMMPFSHAEEVQEVIDQFARNLEPSP
jgi:pimeloyl-ACP methyl ester carboxylesterase